MTGISNSNQGTQQQAPLTEKQVIAMVDEVEGKLTMLGAKEGEVSEKVSDTQVALAKNYTTYINKYIAKAKALSVFTEVMAISSAVAGIGTGGTMGVAGGMGMYSASEGALGLVSDVATIAGSLSDAAGGIGSAVTGMQKSEAMSDEELSSGTIKLSDGEAGELTSDVGQIMKYSNAGKSAVLALIKNENSASTYQG
ncbi:MAG: hypothetical protein S4CHLAM37_11810 [Chlamydiia bacterium]|nr:hypothetical protein [Chlamydiia bacterium]